MNKFDVVIEKLQKKYNTLCSFDHRPLDGLGERVFLDFLSTDEMSSRELYQKLRENGANVGYVYGSILLGDVRGDFDKFQKAVEAL